MATAPFACPRCGMVSHSAADAENGYCGHCHDYTADEPMRFGYLPLLTVAELRHLLGLLHRMEPMHTAVAEAILGARSVRHGQALQAVQSLGRLLATMKLPTPPGMPDVDGLQVFASGLKDVERFVRDHALAEERIDPEEAARIVDLSEAARIVDLSAALDALSPGKDKT